MSTRGPIGYAKGHRSRGKTWLGSLPGKEGTSSEKSADAQLRHLLPTLALRDIEDSGVGCGYREAPCSQRAEPTLHSWLLGRQEAKGEVEILVHAMDFHWVPHTL